MESAVRRLAMAEHPVEGSPPPALVRFFLQEGRPRGWVASWVRRSLRWVGPRT